MGITTPETFTKSTPTYFQDDNGNYIYGFCEGNNGQDLYSQVQKSVNEAKAAGADYVVVMGHIGTDPASTPWTSKEIIENTTGIDAFLDGHSHSTIASEVCKDKEGKALEEGTDYTVTYPSGRKNVGKYTVTINFSGNYTGTVEKTFTIQPKGTSITKASAKSSGFSVEWKKQKTKISGYQIQYSTDKKFSSKSTKTVTVKKNKTSKSVENLKENQKYYVRVCTYTTVKVNGKSVKIYSKFSKQKL